MNVPVTRVKTKVNVLMESIGLLVNVLKVSQEVSVKMVKYVFIVDKLNYLLTPSNQGGCGFNPRGVCPH